MARHLTKTIEGADVQSYLEVLIQKAMSHPNLQVLTQSLIVGFTGFKGNFTTEVLVGPGMYERKIDHGAVILATGATEYRPKEFGYGEDRPGHDPGGAWQIPGNRGGLEAEAGGHDPVRRFPKR